MGILGIKQLMEIRTKTTALLVVQDRMLLLVIANIVNWVL